MVLDGEGKVLPAARDVLQVCAQQARIVDTGQTSLDKALAIPPDPHSPWSCSRLRYVTGLSYLSPCAHMPTRSRRAFRSASLRSRQ
jgi:hypothetical protein